MARPKSTPLADGQSLKPAGAKAEGNTVQFGPRGIGKLRDGTDPRILRFRFEGAMYENFLYLFEMDFAQSAILINQGVSGPFGPLTSTSNTPTALIPTPCDMWIGERNIPIIGNLRIGIQKEPFGFERLVSNRFLNSTIASYRPGRVLDQGASPTSTAGEHGRLGSATTT